ncbi:glycosyltransferase [Mesorhizobium sp. B2-3-4]|uniref:glycosyltransferase n=1 Tax=Mesorhizobium sp. B2-3-4 TaxID=2589959 RepID=UPI00112EFAA1|nr:glycosyltransferase [Mesorhizobium sp. B2-3-4]TPM28103.1 glycosyltransferase [Mesorhizobium sp. B2-3-4]
MKDDHFIRRTLRRARRAIPWRDQLRRGLRSTFRLQSRRDPLRALAEFAGVFDASWYAQKYGDVVASGLDPFTHYMKHGWRAKREPAPGVEIESRAAMVPGFRPGQDNPMSYLLQNLGRLDTRQEKLSESAPLVRILDDGLCVSGYFRSEVGLGQSARNIVYACDAARLPVSARAQALPGRENDDEFASKCNSIVDRKAQLIVLGLASIDRYRLDIAPGRLNIVYPFWELLKIPKEWHAGIRDFDEVWAPSRFVASALASVPGVTPRYVPHPIRLPDQQPGPRADRTKLRFFTFLDFDSYGERKNPQAAVNAFSAAFQPTKRDVELVIKTRGERDRGLRAWLGEAAARDNRIHVVDRTLDRAGMDALMMQCDAFVSLHRSEGLGLGAAEALAAGKAVVATDYGGTTDFINESTGYPVAYALQPVQDGAYVHTEGQVWATADKDAAVEAMRAIHASPQDAEARARNGFLLLKKQQSLAAVGNRIGQILAERGAMPQGWQSRADP